MTGRHKSPYKGFSVEFAEHRQYTRGDDLRNLDWRIYGKIDRYYVKQYIEETNLRATILLDASGSMAFTGERAAKIGGQPASKFVYAQHLAAAFAYLLVSQQDAVGLVTFDSAVPHLSASAQPRVATAGHARRARPHAARRGHQPAGRAARNGRAHRPPRVGGARSATCSATRNELIQALHHFRYRKHEVLLLHVMADEELTFPYDKWTDFRSLEAAGVNAQLDPKSIRAAYLEG